MKDLYVIEGRKNSGKSTLVMHLAAVRGGNAIRKTKFRNKTKRILVIYSSASEGNDPFNPKNPKSGQNMTPDQLKGFIEEKIKEAREKEPIDGILVPLHPEWKGNFTAQDYVNALTRPANGQKPICNLVGYVGIGRGPFKTQAQTAEFPSLAGFTLSNNSNHFQEPSNQVAEAVRTSWQWT